jgi:DNA-binding NarL/FixJ family response regulator
MIRVMLVDDHAVVREGYGRLLGLEDDMKVVAECANADEAYERLAGRDEPPQVLVLDLSMPGRSGLDLLRRVALRWPRLRVLVFSMHDSEAMVAQVMKAGAAGYVTKSRPPDELVMAVRRVARGETVLSADVASAASGADGPPPHLMLSGREFDVLRMLVQGLSVDQVAERMHLSIKTVANYQTAVRQKLGVANAVEMVHYAQRYRLV